VEASKAITSRVKDSIVKAFCAKGSVTYPGAIETIHQITKILEIPVGVIRNSNIPPHAFQTQTIAPLGADPYFNVRTNVVFSAEVGFEKPHPKIFHALVNKVDMAHVHKNVPHRILFVGNETQADIVGAKNVGWKSVLIRNTEQTSNGLADWEIDHFDELLPIIRGEVK